MSVILGSGKYVTVNDVKEKLKKYIGKKVFINYNLGRNKFEEYEVIIKELYNFVFIVEVGVEEKMEIKSFSYSDVITRTIKIDF